MEITLDGKTIEIIDSSRNIVEIAQDNGVTIIAPCFRNKKKFGCCNACIIEVNSEKKFACSTKPIDGMKIIYNRDDLKKQRREKLESYANMIMSGKPNNNICGCSSNDSCGDKESEGLCCEPNNGDSCCGDNGNTGCGCSDSSC